MKSIQLLMVGLMVLIGSVATADEGVLSKCQDFSYTYELTPYEVSEVLNSAGCPMSIEFFVPADHDIKDPDPKRDVGSFAVHHLSRYFLEDGKLDQCIYRHQSSTSRQNAIHCHVTKGEPNAE